MKTSSLLAACLICAFLVPAVSSTPVPLPADDEAAIRAAVTKRVAAVSSGDKALFMSLISPADPEYLLEQSRWFDYRLSATISGLAVEIESITARSGTECVVALHQSYFIGPAKSKRDFRNSQRYARIGGTWFDADMDFAVRESRNFTLRYQGGIDPDRIATVAGHAEKAWNTVYKAYGAAPAGKTVLKIFSDQELLRQNSKITIDRLFNGWAEPGESIRMRLRPDAAYSYTNVLAHELTHKVSLATSKNLCSWFAEGTANHFGSFPAMGGSYLDGGFHTPADYDRSLAWLESFNPETVDNDADWWLYGGMAGVVVEFMEKKYGAGTPQAVIGELAKYPQIESGWVYEKDDATCREYLAAAMKTVIGVTMAEFDASWMEWIHAKRGK